MSKLLFEIFSEEIPATLQSEALKKFNSIVSDVTLKANLSSSECKTFISPWRMILTISDLNADSKIVIELLEKIMLNMQSFWPRTIMWPGSLFKWIRPIRSLLLIHNDTILSGSLHGISLRNKVFIDKANYVELKAEQGAFIDQYFSILRNNNIVFDHLERKQFIESQIHSYEQKYSVTSICGTSLIDEITGLADKPYAIDCEIPSKFLLLPIELINLVLSKNQKYILFKNADGSIFSKFLIIGNGDKKYIDTVRAGNMKVLEARLSDALFYYNIDMKKSVQDFSDKMKKMNFIAGTLYEDYIELQKQIMDTWRQSNAQCPMISNELKYNELSNIIELSKFDLGTGIISEFPELQGIIAGHYGKVFNIFDDSIAAMVSRQYKSFKGSENALHNAFILIDRFAYIIKIWQSGGKPTSSGDPYAIKSKIDDILNIHYLFLSFSLSDFLSKFSLSENDISDIKKLIIKRFIKLYNNDAVSNIIAKISSNFNSICDLHIQYINATNALKNESFCRMYKRLNGLTGGKSIEANQFEEAQNSIIKELDNNGFTDAIIAKIEQYLDTNRILEDNIKLSFISQIQASASQKLHQAFLDIA